MGGKRNGPRFLSTIYYIRVSCSEWQILDVTTYRFQGTHPSRIAGNSYNPARLPQQDIWYRAEYDYGCKPITLGQTYHWPADQNWIFKPGFYFKQGIFVQSITPGFTDPNCDFRSFNLTAATKLRGERR